MIYESFVQWVEAQVLPLRQANPTWIRLDGWDKDGNLTIVARFRYEGEIWEVHGDTRFAPTIRAYEAIRSGQITNPFVRAQTKVTECLNLTPELGLPQRPKHFYVYAQA